MTLTFPEMNEKSSTIACWRPFMDTYQVNLFLEDLTCFPTSSTLKRIGRTVSVIGVRLDGEFRDGFKIKAKIITNIE